MGIPTESEPGAPPPLAWRSGNHTSNSSSFSSPRSARRTSAHSSPARSVERGRRLSAASYNSRHGRNPSSRASISSSIPFVPEEAEPSNMSWISTESAVQEMAFRQGQRDSAYSGLRVPPSPYEPRYDAIWEKHYLAGKAEGGKPVEAPKAGPTAPINSGYEWAPLINPWTQDNEQPTGTVDHEWSRKMCSLALDSMAGLIGKVCQRAAEWEKIVCAVPAPIEVALQAYPDLMQRYQILLRDAHEAKSGGLPLGYN